jgi:hypothetical protein
MQATDTLPALAAALAAYQPPTVSVLRDAELLESHRTLAEMRRIVDAHSAALAAEIAFRSRRELGYDGLAQKLGARTPENLIQKNTGATHRDATTQVRIGELMRSQRPGSDAAPTSPWLAPVSEAVSCGSLSLDAAEVIRAALAGVAGDERVLSRAVIGLVASARELTVEKLAAKARQVRDELDEEGIADRERELREKRYLYLIPQRDGMTKLVGLLDPESAAELTVVIDAATSPRRGGPRFVDPREKAREQRLLDDERTTPQIALDALITLVKIGVAGPSDAFIGARKPGVRLIVSDRDLGRRRGPVVIEGQTVAASVETAERHACEGGFTPIMFDENGLSVINVGRKQRYFTPRQREALAARDGGCRFPGCDRPPAWCEAHHIVEWEKGHGLTNLADGILLCKYHHLLVHNNGWQVIRRGTDYFVVPPASIDRLQRPIPAPSRSWITSRLAS